MSPGADRDGMPGVDAAEEADPRRRLFYLVAVAGIVVGMTFGILEVLDRPVIELGEERVRRDGLVATVQVLATNTSDDTTYCVEVRIGALDREGLDLQDVPAEPQDGEGRMRPGRTINFTAVLDELDEQDYEEELDEFVAYVDERRQC